MDVRTYGRALIRHWVLIVLLTMVAGGAGAMYASRLPSTYASSVTFFIATGTDNNSPLAADSFARQRASTYVGIVEGERFARDVAEYLADVDPGTVQRSLSAKTDINTALLTATVTSSSAERARTLALSVATRLPALVDSLESQTGKRTSPVHLEVVSAPSDGKQTGPPRTRLVAIAALLGLVLAVVLALLREWLDVSIRSSAQLSTASGTKDLGSVPMLPRRGSDDIRPATRESLRKVRTTLLHELHGREHTVVAVVSPLTGADSDAVTTQLADLIARNGIRTALVDADLRRREQTDTDSGPRGLSDVLRGELPLAEVISQSGGHHVLVPAGHHVEDPADVLDSPAMTGIIRDLRESHDVVLINAGAVLPVADATVLASLSDGVVVVARRGQDTLANVQDTLASLRAIDIPVVGTVELTYRRGWRGRR